MDRQSLRFFVICLLSASTEVDGVLSEPMRVTGGADFAHGSAGDSGGELAGLPCDSGGKADEATNDSHGNDGGGVWLAALDQQTAERADAAPITVGAQEARAERERISPTGSSWDIESTRYARPAIRSPRDHAHIPIPTSANHRFSLPPILKSQHKSSARMRFDSNSDRAKAKVNIRAGRLLFRFACKGHKEKSRPDATVPGFC